MLEALLTSTGLVALAEVGDKTQLLSLTLAARYRKPWPIIAGILVATLANHALAAIAGAWLASLLTPAVLRWILGLGFVALGAWLLVPDKAEDVQTKPRYGVFATTLVLFFIAEMGDKTQLATVALSAQFQSWKVVTLGTTLGMLLANVPVIFLGAAFANRLPMRRVQLVAAGLFALLGLYILLFN